MSGGSAETWQGSTPETSVLTETSIGLSMTTGFPRIFGNPRCIAAPRSALVTGNRTVGGARAMRQLLKTLTLIALLAGPIAAQAAPAGTAPSVAAEDRLQIVDLISAYSHTYDRRDIESFIALFTADAVWEFYASGGTRLLYRLNRDELRAAVTKRLEGFKAKGIQSRHYQTNTLLTAVNAGKVEATTIFQITWQAQDEKPALVMTGTFNDVIVKTATGWKFARRTELVDQGDLPQ